MHLTFLFFICTLNGSIYILYDNADYCVNSMGTYFICDENYYVNLTE